MALDELRFRFLLGLILQRVRLFADLCVEFLFLKGDFAIRDHCLFFLACDVRVGLGDLNRLALGFLLDGVGGVRFRLLRVGANQHFRLLHGKLRVLHGNFLFCVRANGVCKLLRFRGGNRDIPLRVCFGDLRVFADLLDVVDTHVFNRARGILEILNVEVNDLDAELFHVGYDVFGDLSGNALTILYHFLESDGTHDLAHVAFEHLGHQCDHRFLTQPQQRFRRAVEQLGLTGNLDICNTVHADVDKLVGRHRFGGLHIDLHHVEREFIHALQKRETPAGFTDQDSALAETGDDKRGVRRGFEIP
ncbi:hypothetical protein SDC9_130684 [bioreactor metagenome]|uniref:NAD-specific glutamate dehydrogenase n=1 Tax=bioreactor metagenome TaxID=1076179 RepID=A0A645D370_9ZZZZ